MHDCKFMIKILLPQKEKIIKTSIDDSGPERYYSTSSLIRKVYLERLQIAIDLIGDRKYEKLLEVGYGNGMLFPTFKKISQEVFGIDIHGEEKAIKDLFDGNFVNGSVYSIPFKDQFFDSIFCLSVIEHLEKLDKVFFEIKRVARDDADIVFGIPSDNIFMKTFFWLKKSPALESHINSKKELIDKISQKFKVIDRKVLRVFGIDVYTALKCRK